MNKKEAVREQQKIAKLIIFLSFRLPDLDSYRTVKNEPLVALPQVSVLTIPNLVMIHQPRLRRILVESSKMAPKEDRMLKMHFLKIIYPLMKLLLENDLILMALCFPYFSNIWLMLPSPIANRSKQIVLKRSIIS